MGWLWIFGAVFTICGQLGAVLHLPATDAMPDVMTPQAPCLHDLYLCPETTLSNGPKPSNRTHKASISLLLRSRYSKSPRSSRLRGDSPASQVDKGGIMVREGQVCRTSESSTKLSLTIDNQSHNFCRF